MHPFSTPRPPFVSRSYRKKPSWLSEMEMCCYVEALSSILSSSVPSGALGGSQLKRQKFQSLNIGLGFPEELSRRRAQCENLYAMFLFYKWCITWSKHSRKGLWTPLSQGFSALSHWKSCLSRFSKEWGIM